MTCARFALVGQWKRLSSDPIIRRSGCRRSWATKRWPCSAMAPKGRGQSLNMKDNGVNVVVGLREQGRGWDLAQQDGWVPGKTLFPLEEAAHRGTIVQYLLSDAGQKEQWPALKPLFDRRQSPVFLAWFQHRLQRSDRRRAAQGHRRHSRRPQRFRHHACAGCFWKARASTPAMPSIRMPPAAPWTAAWPAGSPLAPATFSRPLFKRKSSAT